MGNLWRKLMKSKLAITLPLGSWKQKDQEFKVNLKSEARLNHTRPCLKKNK